MSGEQTSHLAVTTVDDGVSFPVWVVPGSTRAQVTGVHGDALRVRLTAPPERGRANRELLRLLEAFLERPVEMTGGERSRRKRVLVRGIDAPRLEARLRRFVA